MTWFELGSYGPNESVSYRLGGGAWIAAGFNASAAFNEFDFVQLSLDLLNDTISFAFHETAANTTHNILANATLGGDMDYLAHMGLFMKAENSKNFLDDFDFSVAAVPEPSTLMLLALGTFITASQLRPRLERPQFLGRLFRIRSGADRLHSRNDG